MASGYGLIVSQRSVCLLGPCVLPLQRPVPSGVLVGAGDGRRLVLFSFPLRRPSHGALCSLPEPSSGIKHPSSEPVQRERDTRNLCLTLRVCLEALALMPCRQHGTEAKYRLLQVLAPHTPSFHLCSVVASEVVNAATAPSPLFTCRYTPAADCRRRRCEIQIPAQRQV